MQNYFRKGDETWFDSEIFEQTTSKGQIIRFFFDDITDLLPFDERIAAIVYNVGVLIEDAAIIDDREYLLIEDGVNTAETEITGRAPIEDAIKALRMFKECVKILREKTPNCKIGFAVSWLDEKRQKTYAKVLSKMGFVVEDVGGEDCLYKMFDPMDDEAYEQNRANILAEVYG